MPPSKKPSSTRKKPGRPGNFFFVLFLLGLLAGCGWLWWHRQHPEKTSPPPPAARAPIVTPSARPIPAPTPSALIPTPVIPIHPVPLPPPKIPTRTNSVVVTPPVAKPTPTPPTSGAEETIHDTLELQVALARQAISPGALDSALGSQTHAALAAFQRSENLAVSGKLDDDTRALLALDAPPFTTYTVTADDLASLQPIGKTWLEKSQQSSLAYETELELVGEKAHSNPLLIKKLNPGVDWANITAGTVLKIPDVEYPKPVGKAAFVIIHLADRFLEAFDAQTNLLAHFPCSIAAKVEKRPVGELHVVVIAPNPNYTVNPELFPESDELKAIGHKLILPPGPNNPVGIAWIGLDRPGYGMHGTPIPEQVGRTESHGCFRLANWDAAYMVKLAWVGMPVEVEP